MPEEPGGELLGFMWALFNILVVIGALLMLLSADCPSVISKQFQPFLLPHRCSDYSPPLLVGAQLIRIYDNA